MKISEGLIFERLIVLKRDLEYEGKLAKWICKCDCGKIISVASGDLNRGHTKSCGCYGRDKLIVSNTTHNQTKTPEYKVWKAMKERCLNHKNRYYHNYGGRGIKVCNRWLGSDGFYNFISDMGHRPSPKHTLERVENNKGYGPKNCIWELRGPQSRNKRNNHWIKAEGKTMVITDWARYLGLTSSGYVNRHLRTKTMEELIFFRRRKGGINEDFVPPYTGERDAE